MQLTCLVMGVILLTGWVAAQDRSFSPQATSGNLHVEFTDNLVTLRTHRVPINEVLKAIARETGLAMTLHGHLDEPITVKIQQLPLPKAMGRILRHQNFALSYVRSSGSPGRGAGPSKLWVFAKGPGYFSNRVRDTKYSVAVESSTMETYQPEPLNDDQQIARETVRDLAGPEEDEAIEQLSYALGDTDPKVRVKAVSTLAEMGSDEAASTLVGALGDSDPLVREEVVHAMGEIGGVTATLTLGQTLLDQDTHVRAAAVEALAEIGGDRSVQLLIVALQDKNTSVREQAVDALGEIGSDAAIQLLPQAFKDDEVNVRAAAIEALADIGGDDAARALAIALSDKNPSVRSEAVHALESIGSEVAADVLEQVLENE